MVQLVEELTSNYIMGDPMDPKVNLGPMARIDLLETLKKQLRKTIELGASVIYGNKATIFNSVNPNEGNYFAPIILENVPKNSPGFREEVFGPAFMMFKFKTEEEAIQMANDTEYGLR